MVAVIAIPDGTQRPKITGTPRAPLKPMQAASYKLFETLVPSLAAFGIFAFLPQKSLAKPEFTHITKQECAYCHASLRDRKLTEAGLYFRKHRTLKGYRPGTT